MGDLRAALESYERTLVVRERLVASDKADIRYLRALAQTYGRISDLRGLEVMQTWATRPLRFFTAARRTKFSKHSSRRTRKTSSCNPSLTAAARRPCSS